MKPNLQAFEFRHHTESAAMPLTKSSENNKPASIQEKQITKLSVETLDRDLLLVEQFKTLYRGMCSEDLHEALLEEVYADDLLFLDSFHEINGRDAFLNYCSELYQNLKSCDFEFHDQWLSKGEAMLTWSMTYSHPKLKSGKDILVEGATHIRFKEKIHFHRDYVDGGALLYEHVPVLGSIIKQLKKRMV